MTISKSNSSFHRGFKAWCENTAVNIRTELGLAPRDPLPSTSLAQYLGVQVATPNDIPELGEEDRQILLTSEHHSWSAVTVSVGRCDMVILNPTHSLPRRNSNLMHELSHLLLGHDPATMLLSMELEVAIRSFDATQESEATWLAGCLLLPRPAAMHITRSRWPEAMACRRYGISTELLRYRMNVTGVLRHRDRIAKRVSRP